MRQRYRKARAGEAAEQAAKSPGDAQPQSWPSEVSVFAYTEETFEERRGVSVEDVAAYCDRPGVVWIDVDGLATPGVVERICGLYRIHPLIVEDTLTVTQRPKLEVFDEYASLVFKMVYLADDGSRTVTEHVSLILGRGWVLSFQQGPIRDVFEPVRDAIRTRKGRVRRSGADHLAYFLVDAVVDNYLKVLDKMNEQIEDFEDEMLSSPTPATLHAVHALRNEIIFLRKSAWPLRDILDRLPRDADELFAPTTFPYLKDVSDHTSQALDQIDVMRDIVTGLLEMYLSSMSYNLNSVLKRLTLITTIFMPLSVLAGIGGMSEWTMMTGSENWRWSYPLFMTGLTAAGVGSYLWLKKKKWV
ncbi:MAG: magnesium/cobalt transporter CorA [Deltaproteobacteria bacterium]|nr:magnesium/cobalt transporter CorA [Deltaproteobacteria bacterium]